MKSVKIPTGKSVAAANFSLFTIHFYFTVKSKDCRSSSLDDLP